MDELKKLFESVDKEILNEETLQKLSDLVKSKIDNTVKERVDLELKSALEEQSIDHGQKLKRVLEAIDVDHTAKVKKVVETIDKRYVEKLKTIQEKYSKLLKETAVKHRDTLVESVNEWVDIYLEKNLPREMIAEAAKNKYIENVLKEARSVLSVDSTVIKENIRTAIKDGKNQMDQLIKENAELKQRNAIESSKRLLAEKTANLPANMAKYVTRQLEGRPVEFIKENFSYVVEMFERKEEKEKRSAISNKQKPNVDRQKIVGDLIKEENEIQTINESVNTAKDEHPMMNLYMDGLNFKK